MTTLKKLLPYIIVIIGLLVATYIYSFMWYLKDYTYDGIPRFMSIDPRI